MDRRGAPHAPCLVLALLAATGTSRGDVLVAEGSDVRYLANTTDPGAGTSWTAEGFVDDSWPLGSHGCGYEAAPPGASALIETPVPPGTRSVYTRARFLVPDVASITTLVLGADFDDGWIAWINGVEVYRSPQMPPGTPAWNSAAASHESSNGGDPGYAPLFDVSAAGIPALHAGTNVLAVGVWNQSAASSDLVLVPKLEANPTPYSVTRGPYLQRGSPTSVVVRWRTNAATESRVRYGPAPGNLPLQVDDPALTTEHAVALTGLAPGTGYTYAVGTTAAILAGNDSAHRFETSPEPGAITPTRVWVLGDSGTANTSARAVRDAYRTFTADVPTDLWLMLGDNAYLDGTDAQYQAAVFDVYPRTLRRSVLWPTFGNHDAVSADSGSESGPYYAIFSLPRAAEAGGLASGTEAYYSFDRGNVHYVCLDSQESSRSPTGAMLTWLALDLADTDREWVIAFWHHPPYTKGSHDSDVEGQLVDMRVNALPILEAAGVDLVLCGHSHSYERSFLIDGHYGLSGEFNASHQLDAGDGNPSGDGAYRKPSYDLAPHEGAVHVVAGSSGQTSGGPLDHPAMFRSLDELGSVVLDIHGNRLDATFLDDAAVVRDSFTIVKGQAPPPVPDGALVPGAPLTARKSSADPSRVDVTWDATCAGSTDHNLYRGAIGDFSTVTGGVCGLGDSGSASSLAIPEGSWWIIDATNAAGARIGRHGATSAGAERALSGWPSVCAQQLQDLDGSCP